MTGAGPGEVAAPPRPVRVLVCDDQAVVRAGYAAIFADRAGLEVAGEAGDGQTAVACALRLRPDVVVMDIRMPVLDGIEATRRLAGPGVDAPVKVLLVTTFSLDAYVHAALRAGASGYLLKDCPPEELVSGVRTVARGEALIDPAVTRRLIGHYADRILPQHHPRPGPGHPLAALTQRETEVLRLIANGLSNAEIAGALVLSPETVKTYVSRILAKLQLRDRVQAVVLAYRAGLITSQCMRT